MAVNNFKFMLLRKSNRNNNEVLYTNNMHYFYKSIVVAFILNSSEIKEYRDVDYETFFQKTQDIPRKEDSTLQKVVFNDTDFFSLYEENFIPHGFGQQLEELILPPKDDVQSRAKELQDKEYHDIHTNSVQYSFDGEVDTEALISSNFHGVVQKALHTEDFNNHIETGDGVEHKEGSKTKGPVTNFDSSRSSVNIHRALTGNGHIEYQKSYSTIEEKSKVTEPRADENDSIQTVAKDKESTANERQNDTAYSNYLQLFLSHLYDHHPYYSHYHDPYNSAYAAHPPMSVKSGPVRQSVLIPEIYEWDYEEFFQPAGKYARNYSNQPYQEPTRYYGSEEEYFDSEMTTLPRARPIKIYSNSGLPKLFFQGYEEEFMTTESTTLPPARPLKLYSNTGILPLPIRGSDEEYMCSETSTMHAAQPIRLYSNHGILPDILHDSEEEYFDSEISTHPAARTVRSQEYTCGQMLLRARYCINPIKRSLDESQEPPIDVLASKTQLAEFEFDLEDQIEEIDLPKFESKMGSPKTKILHCTSFVLDSIHRIKLLNNTFPETPSDVSTPSIENVNSSILVPMSHQSQSVTSALDITASETQLAEFECDLLGDDTV